MTDDNPIIVTGCQRSGTTITAHILAQSKDYVVFEDDLWLPYPEAINDLKDMINSGRTKIVIQSPTALNCFHHLYHRIPSLHWVGVNRDKKEIIASMKRVKWLQDDYPDYLPFYKHHIRFMTSQWGLLKQLLPPENWTEVNYDELKDYPQFIPKNLRSDFTMKQTALNLPKGPKYWLSDEKGWEETDKITSESSKLLNSG